MPPPSWASLLISSIPPIQVPTEHWTEFPVLYSFFQLAIYFTHGSVYVSAALSILPTLSIPLCVHKVILYVGISNLALQIGSSVSFF